MHCIFITTSFDPNQQSQCNCIVSSHCYSAQHCEPITMLSSCSYGKHTTAIGGYFITKVQLAYLLVANTMLKQLSDRLGEAFLCGVSLLCEVFQVCLSVLNFQGWDCVYTFKDVWHFRFQMALLLVCFQSLLNEN